jgi:hypothetical protein
VLAYPDVLACPDVLDDHRADVVVAAEPVAEAAAGVAEVVAVAAAADVAAVAADASSSARGRTRGDLCNSAPSNPRH